MLFYYFLVAVGFSIFLSSQAFSCLGPSVEIRLSNSSFVEKKLSILSIPQPYDHSHKIRFGDIDFILQKHIMTQSSSSSSNSTHSI